MNGILPLWKPKGMTSHDCVAKIRRLYQTKKVGHTGTLDPGVEGVLPICIGQATKIVPYLTNTEKVYIAELSLGSSTDTEDASGKVINQKQVNYVPSNEEIETVLKQFRGQIIQIPPMYSAVKVNGRKLYEYARANKTVERPKRKVSIHQLQLLGTADNRINLKIVCSKGTYIRTLCVDIGEALGYPAHMSDLVRTKTGSFMREDTVTFEQIETKVEEQKQAELLLPMIEGLSHLDYYSVDEDTCKKVLFGQKLKKPMINLKTDPFIILYQKEMLAIYQTHPENADQIKPVRVFPLND
ncbi:tRNA pseudouridine(55) synthase TruB [Virgibacillus phasianinus]|uniref:tRNA pseudouridine synthase B n=1 Tax=Virgibacillus phasianinus TaxID=2017483 RepID=A0A220U675_9BACI|nr:tRNA pseudouridine(55) synthase TruB [Virgibacillus phasianinus]ASK63482.1 tRNA pseudouridine(55) synthase TruB [Virgibacillus phasianinus]